MCAESWCCCRLRALQEEREKRQKEAEEAAAEAARRYIHTPPSISGIT
jgi:hypothetical protein